MKTISRYFCLLFLLLTISCSEEIDLFEDGVKKNAIYWDKTYTVSVKVPRYSACWVITETENLDYFSGAILSNNNTTHIGKGEFISTLDYLNFNLILKKDFALNLPLKSTMIIDINCNNDQFMFKKTYNIVR
jgi:hypothetical protein|tara:strand:+ start:3054 stop:3449 length:396 start_codon:yes stop_codon:yes gene_type:complete